MPIDVVALGAAQKARQAGDAAALAAFRAVGQLPQGAAPLLDADWDYDASLGEAGVSSGQAVAQLTNRAGTSFNGIPGTSGTFTSASAPKWVANVQNGKAAYRFDGVDDVCRIAGYGMRQPCTVVACVAPGKGGTADEALFGTGSSAGLTAIAANLRWRLSASGANAVLSDNGMKMPAATVVAVTLDGGERGTLATGVVGSNNALSWAARRGGPTNVRAQLQNAGASRPLVVTAVTNIASDPITADVNVQLATDASSVITSTANDVIAAVNAHGAAAQLLSVTNTTGSSGAGVMTALNYTALSVVGELIINGRYRTSAANLAQAGLFAPMYIGAGQNGTGNPWGGDIFRIKGWQRRLSQSELAMEAAFMMSA